MLHVRPLPVATLAAVLSAAVVGVTWAAQVHFAPGDLRDGLYVHTDFFQYCAWVGAHRDGIPVVAEHRSPGVARLVAQLAERFGVIDGLLVAAVSCFAGMTAAFAMHAGAVSGRVGAFSAALSTLLFPPLVLVGRSLSYYPAMAFTFALAAAGASWALASGRLGVIAVASVLVFLPPLADVRGVLWTFPCAGLVALAAIIGPPGANARRRLVGGLAGLSLLAAAAVLSWRVGREVWAPDSTSGIVEQMVGQVTALVGDNGGGKVRPPSCARGAEIVWGRSDPARMPEAIGCLLAAGRLQAQLPPRSEGAEVWARVVRPGIAAGVGAALLAALSLIAVRRSPRPALALLLPLFPAASALLGASSEPDIRRLELGYLWLPPVVGAAVGGVTAALDAGMGWALLKLHWRSPPWRRLLLDVLILSLVVTAVAGWLPWSVFPLRARPYWVGTSAPWVDLRWRDRVIDVEVACSEAVARDIAAGRHGKFSAELPAPKVRDR